MFPFHRLNCAIHNMTAQKITTENLNYIVCPTVGIGEDKIFLC